MKKLINYFFMFIALTFLGAVILSSFWLLYPYNVITFNTTPYPVLNENKTVERGGRLIYEVNACKYMDTVPILKKFFIDGVIYEVPESVGAVESGCHVNKIDVYVPRAIPAGTYHMKFVARYKVNPIRVIETINYSEQFTVK